MGNRSPNSLLSFQSLSQLPELLTESTHRYAEDPHSLFSSNWKLKSGRSFPIPSKKCILGQAYLTLYYLKVRSKYVKPLAAKWTVHPLGKQVTPCFAWGFEVSPSTLHEYIEAMKLFVKKNHSSTEFPVTSTQPHGKSTATPVSTAFKGRLILLLFFSRHFWNKYEGPATASNPQAISCLWEQASLRLNWLNKGY